MWASFTPWWLTLWPHAHYFSRQCVCVCVCPFGFIWSSVMSHTVCLVLHLSLPQGRSVQDKHLIWPGPCFSRRPPRLIFRAQLLQKSFVFVDFEYSRDWWMLVFFCLKMTRVSGKININKSNRKTPRCVFKKREKEKHDIWNIKHNNMLAMCQTSEEK